MTSLQRKIVCVVGARPNFVKAAPLLRQLRLYPDQFSPLLVHTGQHYDDNLSQQFFRDLEIPTPDEFLNIGSGSHAEQTAKIMIGIENTLQRESPELVVVFGDVNSTLAAAITASKLRIPLAHVESGLRNFDRSMPEEINRVLTDHLADILFASEESALANLAKEGIAKERVFLVGNIMIDSLCANLDKIKQAPVLDRLGLQPLSYATLTLHRANNVDESKILADLLSTIAEIAESIPVVFPCHPRTQKRMKEFGLADVMNNSRVRLTEPFGYLDFCALVHNSRFVLTDSGGIQEETTYMGIPCLTMRENTERPVTVQVGTNVLCGTDRELMISEARKIVTGEAKTGEVPRLWDGHTAERIVTVLQEWF